MRTLEAAVSILVLLAISQVNLGQTLCILPPPGRCSSNIYPIIDSAVHPLTAGSCDFTQASDLCCYQQGCRDPVMSNWTLERPRNRKGRAQAKQDAPGNCGSDYYYSVLESPWLSVTQESCLKFTYSRSMPAALDVFLEQRGGHSMTVLKRSDNSGENQRTEVQTLGPGIGKVIFRAYGGGGDAGYNAYVRVYKVSVETGSCNRPVSSNPPEAGQCPSGQPSPSPSVSTKRVTTSPTAASSSTSSTPLSSSTSSSPLSSSTSSSTLSSSSSSSSQGTKENTAQTPGSVMSGEQKESNIGAIVGGVAAAVIVIIIIVAVIVIDVRRRRPLKKNDDKEMITAVNRGIDYDIVNVAEQRSSDDYTVIRGSHFAPSMPVDDNGYSDIQHGDTDPYDLPEDGAPGKTRPTSGEDDYNHIGMHNRAAAHEVVADDDYHHIQSPQAIPEPEDSYTYHLAQAIPEPEDSYTYHPVQAIPEPEDSYTYHPVQAIPEPEDSYTYHPVQAIPEPEGSYTYYLAQDKTSSPTQPEHNYTNYPTKDKASCPTQPELGYIYTQNHNQHGSKTKEGTPDSSNAYTEVNKKAKKPALAPKPTQLKGVNISSDPKQPGEASTKEDVDDDEYNRLNFDDSHTGDVATKANRAAIGPYDHVGDNPDTEYSMADGRKRHVVMDSDYDHLHEPDA